MPDRRSRSKGPAPWWFGGLFLATGGFIMLMGLEVIPVDPSSIHAPMWVITAAGAVFFLGGVMALTQGVVSDRTQTALAVVFIALFAVICTWVGFGPGEREFSGGVSLGPVSVGSRGPSGGRIVFGLSAVVLWLVVVAIAVKAFRRDHDERPNRKG